MGLRITGGRVLTPDGFAATDLVLRDGRFAFDPLPDDRKIQADGLWLLPGLIDLHGDGFERHLAPRRGVMTDLRLGLQSVEAELALSGITTAWLAQFWSWEGGMRGPDFARRLAEAHDSARSGLRTDMRLQLRLESHMVEDADAVLALIRAHGMDYVVVNDHLPHAALDGGKMPARLAGSASKAGRSPEAHLAEMRRLAGFAPQVPGFVAQMAAALAADGVRLGSHDDTTAAERAERRALGLAISEFPTSREAAAEAKAHDEPVVMGAPNVVRGGSHDRRVSAEALIAEGLVDALASDYHYPAMAAAAWTLADRGTLDFSDAWALMTSGPARIMGLTDRGKIAPDTRADLTVLDPDTRQTLGTFAGGKPVALRGSLADALLS